MGNNERNKYDTSRGGGERERVREVTRGRKRRVFVELLCVFYYNVRDNQQIVQKE